MTNSPFSQQIWTIKLNKTSEKKVNQALQAQNWGYFSGINTTCSLGISGQI